MLHIHGGLGFKINCWSADFTISRFIWMEPQYMKNVFVQGRNTGSRELAECVWERIEGAAGSNSLCQQASHVLAD
jgi:hypothetical protein